MYQNEEGAVAELEGISAHAMEPDNGKNAGIYLANFLSALPLDGEGKGFVDWINRYFYQDTRGKKLDISTQDEVSGELTVNVGIIHYEKGKEKTVSINIRYPVTKKGARLKKN